MILNSSDKAFTYVKLQPRSLYRIRSIRPELTSKLKLKLPILETYEHVDIYDGVVTERTICSYSLRFSTVQYEVSRASVQYLHVTSVCLYEY